MGGQKKTPRRGSLWRIQINHLAFSFLHLAILNASRSNLAMTLSLTPRELLGLSVISTYPFASSAFRICLGTVATAPHSGLQRFEVATLWTVLLGSGRDMIASDCFSVSVFILIEFNGLSDFPHPGNPVLDLLLGNAFKQSLHVQDGLPWDPCPCLAPEAFPAIPFLGGCKNLLVQFLFVYYAHVFSSFPCRHMTSKTTLYHIQVLRIIEKQGFNLQNVIKH